MEIELVATQRENGIGFKFRDANTLEEVKIKNTLQFELESYSFITLANWDPMEEKLQVRVELHLPFIWEKIS